MILDTLLKDEKRLVFIYTTCSDSKEARSLGFAALEEKLAICADFWPIESIYPWNGVIQDADQYMLVLTTQKDLSDKLIRFILGIHSYKIPVISESGAKIRNPAYSLWAERTLASNSDYISRDEARKRQKFEEEDGYHPGKLK